MSGKPTRSPFFSLIFFFIVVCLNTSLSDSLWVFTSSGEELDFYLSSLPRVYHGRSFQPQTQAPEPSTFVMLSFTDNLWHNCSKSNKIKASLSIRGMALIDLTFMSLFYLQEKIDIASEDRHNKLRFLLAASKILQKQTFAL